MIKKVLLFVLLSALIAACFIPVTEQRTTIVKSPFINLYAFLASPQNWIRWYPDLRKYADVDSNKVSVQKDSTSFVLKYADVRLNVRRRANFFGVTGRVNNKTINYAYSLLPVPDKIMNKTSVSAEENTMLLNYLIGKIWPDSLKDTHLYDLKAYMETDSLRYGYQIDSTGVPASYVIEMKRKVLKENKFSAAKQMFADLQQYIETRHIKQLQPVMAQYLPKGKDSVEVNVGLFIDKEIKQNKEFYFVSMPKGGQLYAIKYKGIFDKRYRLYAAAKQYYTDHSYHMLILPFETYLDNKLPSSDTDRVNIQVNFSAVF